MDNLNSARFCDSHLIDRYLTNEWVVIDEIVQLLWSDQKWTDNTSFVYGFLRIGNTSIGYKVDNAISKHLWVDPQILVIMQSTQYGIRNLKYIKGNSSKNSYWNNMLLEI